MSREFRGYARDLSPGDNIRIRMGGAGTIEGIVHLVEMVRSVPNMAGSDGSYPQEVALVTFEDGERVSLPSLYEIDVFL